jgi:hypothetical protein
MSFTVVLAIIGATLPGVLVALISDYLSSRREVRETARLSANARMLVQLEVASNRDALRAFWDTINGLDKEQKPTAEEHLAGMANGGMLGYTLPEWSFVRWERFPPQAFGALRTKAVAELDVLYRELRAITEMYAKLVTFSPEERDELNHDRFWYNRFAGWRAPAFERLAQVVGHALSAQPLGQ